MLYKGFDLVAKYKYDAWGNCTILQNNDDDIANVNPFRYRGYFYDIETGLYYLQSRYYDPSIGRFISPDSVEYLEPDNVLGLNLYAYCYNNPIMYFDPSGHFPILTLGIFALVGGLVSGVASAISQYVLNGSIDVGDMLISAGFGALSAGLAFIGIGGVLGQFLLQGALSVAEDLLVANYHDDWSDISTESIIFSFTTSGILGMLGAKTASQEFKRVAQIEKSMFKAMRTQIKYAHKGMIKTTGKKISQQFGKKSAKNLINKIIKPGIKDLLVDEMLNWALGTSSNLIF